MNMLIPPIPRPHYPLTKYNSRQLMAWFENLSLRRHYYRRRAGHMTASQEQHSFLDVVQICDDHLADYYSALLERGYLMSELVHVDSLIEQDVNS